MSNSTKIRGGTNTDVKHDSAIKHVTGSADYCDDIAEPIGTLHAYLGVSKIAHATLKGIDYSKVLAAPGVVGVLTADDIPGINDISPTHLND
ncbi:MAG: xanthine dehydrogenase molybdopterin binding subunit, partial [Rhizobiaceae bacterium]